MHVSNKLKTFPLIGIYYLQEQHSGEIENEFNHPRQFSLDTGRVRSSTAPAEGTDSQSQTEASALLPSSRAFTAVTRPQEVMIQGRERKRYVYKEVVCIFAWKYH